MKRIILTGGGTAGHVTPNLALIPKLKKEGWDIRYIGSKKGIEKNLIKSINIPYYGISSGKLRRYKDIKNLTDPFRVIAGCFEALRIISKLKPNIIFSKGGYVSVPVVVAGWILRVPVIIHESDLTPGLANKLAFPFAKKICVNFPETLSYIPKEKGILTGTPIREELFLGDYKKGLKLCDFDNKKPVIMIMGGSLGSVTINKVVRSSLDKLLKSFNIIHICGKNNKDSSLENIKGYKQFEYVNEELPHLFAAASLLISRAGANSIFEILSLKKPNILIPLSAKASRGDQILNAKSFKKQGFSEVIEEENLKKETFLDMIINTYSNREKYIESMKKSNNSNGIEKVMELIRTHYKK
ncbi:undecaprenyldiphospho-muramoylpentapeptide beta-N-acetylglucosaminyltransferase [Defluviitalea phaphyphila]|uniref:undecaprenyldiphospho-muramoylpentapeptide beta-N-acetylglucosaminyltransferase n=1 Tax=Defluviitalea phaphyphila TaxID=1473580 RepID=UPI000731931D|nr:undecaprenyldiphospho-muramoylpentapeptide beta-N-acetylglucosaminyltransferase [Defluviitalea phaphyphila]